MFTLFSYSPRFGSAELYGRDAKNKPCLGVRLKVDGIAKLKIGHTVVDAPQADVSSDTLVQLNESTASEIGEFLQSLINTAHLPNTQVDYLDHKKTLVARWYEPQMLQELFASVHPFPEVTANPHWPERLRANLLLDAPEPIDIMDITTWRKMDDKVIEALSRFPFMRKKPQQDLKDTNKQLFNLSKAFWRIFHPGEPNSVEGNLK